VELMIVRTFLLFASVLFSMSLGEDPKYCGYDEVTQLVESAHPGFKASSDYVFELAKLHANESGKRDIIYQIPTVFHIVYNNDVHNLPDHVIESQVDVRNVDFRRLNENANETRKEFFPFTADVEIEFPFAS